MLALTSGAKGWDLLRLDNLFFELLSFAQLIEYGLGRIKGDDPGPQNAMRVGLVRALANIVLEYTGQRLSQSKKKYGPSKKQNVADFIIEAAKIADPNLEDKRSSI